LEERIKELEKERESLEEKHSIEMEESVAKNVEEKEALTKSIDELNSTVNELKSQLAEEEVVKEQLVAEGKAKEEELQASLQQLREEITSKGSLTDDLEKAHKVELDRLRQETDALKAKIGSSEGDIKAAGEATQVLEERIKELEKERESLEEKHSIEMEELKTKVRKGISSYKEEINSLTENLTSAKDSNEQLVMQCEEHKKMETSLKKDLLEARSDAKLVNGLRNSLEQSTSQLEAERKLSSNMRSDLQAMKKAHDESTVNIQMKFADQLKSSEIEIMKHKDQISALQSELASSRDTIDKLTEAMASTRNSLEVSEQNERSLKSRVGDLETSLNEAITNSRSTATSLIDRQETLENENNKLKDLLEKSKQRDMTSREKIKAISSELESTRKSKDEAISNEKMLSEKLAEELNSKLTSSASDLALARNEISTLKSDQATLENTLARFKSERDASERRHGQRTALVGMLEAQLNEQKEENTQTKSKVDELLSCIDQKEQDILQLEKELETAKAGLHEAKQSKERFADRNNASAEIARKDIERQHRAQLEALQQQMARKSAAAQKLLQQREQECIELRKSNKAMKHELDSGSSSDRHIFELAAKQSNRESLVATEVEIREELMSKLTQELSSRDIELAVVEKAVLDAEEQVEELCRIKRREDVNLDYLKSVVVKFLSLPTGSSEKASLLPVLATLLQFDEEDYKSIDTGKSKVDWFWGTIIPTSIAAPGPSNGVARTGAREVKVSGITTSTTTNTSFAPKSSLQF